MNLLKLFKKLVPQNIKNYYHFIQAIMAVCFYRYPARNLNVIGVTGTDGKTTTATLIYHFLKTAGKKVALVSSVAAYIGDTEIDTGFHVTNPDPWPLQKLLRKIVSLKCEYVVLEVTSHGLHQFRTLGTNIKTAVLTNITREHLDYHKTYLNYVKAKAKLFRTPKVAILNKADKSFLMVKKFVGEQVNIIPYDSNTSKDKVRSAIRTRFPEVYNQENATAALLVAKELGVDDKIIVKALSTFPGVPGRMQEVKNKKGFRIIVDFAHTPNALESVLKSLKKTLGKGGRLIAVFGCASERDETKRPVMGEISTRLADVSILTAEDPRFENVDKIIDEIASGASRNKKPKKLYKIQDRGEAISFAINKVAKKGDLIVICGKGHEKSMNYNGIEYPWSDEKAVNYALNRRVLKIGRGSNPHI